MPNYKTHVKINCFFFLPAWCFLLHYLFDSSFGSLATISSTFTYATFFMNPDLDLQHSFKLSSLRGLLSLPFLGYSRVFKHRGISHHPIVGTLTRVIWITGFAIIMLGFYKPYMHSLSDAMELFKTHQDLFLNAFFGILLADLSHILLDWLKK
jgi:uncharacterized metal-binding protein